MRPPRLDTMVLLRSPLVRGLAILAPIVAVIGWQYYELQLRNAHHREAHRRLGEALWNAVDGVAVREFRGGQYVPGDVALALAESQQRFGLQWVAIEVVDGGPIAHAGVLPDRALPEFWFEHPFVPLRPQGLGPRRSSGEVRTVPDAQLVLQVVLPPGVLLAELNNDLLRMLVTSGSLALVIVLAAFALGSRSRRLVLRSELAVSEARLEGLETMRRIGAGLVHETRNPLGVVRGFAERIARGQLAAAELQSTANAILDETDRTVARLDEFLLLSRPARVRRVAVGVRDLFLELATLLRSEIESAGARLVLRGDAAVIEADRDQLRRLLMNLLLNAAQAVGPGNTVELFCERQGNRWQIGVQDDGPGVPPELQATLFEPYVSGRAGGTGLGLAIARRIAQDHAFTLRYEPRQPHGANMILEVPA
jgi:signal transduction histidine kinase